MRHHRSSRIPKDMVVIKQKIQDLLDELNQGLVEREAAVKAILLSVLAAENMVLIGPPGTGKSMVARRVAEVFQANQETHSASDYFEYLLTKFSTPEEIFGPLSITELKADRFKRNTTGYLPSVRMAFLDEIFKASSSILNSLLTILNERVYHNGAEAQRVPLMSLIAASNELPTGQEELAALYDRFLIRSFVDYVSADNMVLLFENKSPEPLKNRLTHKDIAAIQRSASSVKIPNEIAEAVQRIWTEHKETFKEDAREYLSDRRLKKIVQLLRISAATNERQEVNLSDVVLLKDCLWNHQDNARKVKDIIFDVLKKYNKRVLQETVNKNNNSQSAHSHSHAKQDAIIKGFKGCGTQDDPLLVESVEHLMDMRRSEVGSKGYYFKQTANIDCSNLSHWSEISFDGFYDGGGFFIKHKPIKSNAKVAGGFMSAISHSVSNGGCGDGYTFKNLFCNIQEQSHINSLKLCDLHLSGGVSGVNIYCCSSSVALINGTVKNCKIKKCDSEMSLVDGDVNQSEITECCSNSVLITGESKDTSIIDCAVNIKFNNRYSCNVSGITSALRGGKIERCYVGGTVKDTQHGDVSIYGFSHTCQSGYIACNALGMIKSRGAHVSLVNRIVHKGTGGFTLKNNVSIDANSGVDASDGLDGRTISASLFTQRLFEHTLGWDFESIWQWNIQLKRPELRFVGAEKDADVIINDFSPMNKVMVDLLRLEIKENVWL